MKKMQLAWTCGAAATVMATANPAAAVQDSAERRCAALTRLALADTVITSVTFVPAGPYTGKDADIDGTGVTLPAHCRVVGTIKPTPRSNIVFETWLPADGWNGKFHGVGNGGFAGDINYRGGLVEGTARGYAVASTDTGHSPGGFTAPWAVGNVDAQIDYGHRAIHLTAVNAKAIIAAYYGRGPRYSVFSSCSNGGRQALMAAQRYPADYDGIIAGAPAWDFTRLSQIFIWNGRSLTRTPGSNIPPAKLPAIQSAVLAQCDGLDGQLDGLVRDPRACRFDTRPLLCAGADSNACLSADQVAALGDILQGPQLSRGARIGYAPAGVEALPGGWAPWISSTDPMMTGAGVFGLGIPRFFAGMPGTSFASFDFDRDGPLLDRRVGSILNADSVNLSAFFGRGGKLILYHGWGDAAIPPQMSIEYHDRVRAAMGSKADKAMRLFMVPGMQHCNGGSGVNSFGQGAPPSSGARPEEDIGAALEAWIERGRAPEQIVGVSASNVRIGPMDRRAAKPTRSGLLCAYPNIAVWNGKGNPDSADSYRCRSPR